jgi:hypothetical protein
LSKPVAVEHWAWAVSWFHDVYALLVSRDHAKPPTAAPLSNEEVGQAAGLQRSSSLEALYEHLTDLPGHVLQAAASAPAQAPPDYVSAVDIDDAESLTEGEDSEI